MSVEHVQRVERMVKVLMSISTTAYVYMKKKTLFYNINCQLQLHIIKEIN